MPFLSDPEVEHLLKLASLHGECRECGRRTAQDYCRSCDEFYWLHFPGCVMYEDKHYGHRLTIVPFIEDRGWGGPLEISRQTLATREPECIFFGNGVTAVLRDGQQQKHLQQSWLELFAEFLESHGEDPTAFRLTTPHGNARFFRTEDGWSWRFD